jgi:hypothetical protein
MLEIMRSRAILFSLLLHIALCANSLGHGSPNSAGVLSSINNVVVVDGYVNQTIQAAVSAATSIGGGAKIVIPKTAAGSPHSISSSITTTASPSNLWIHCESGAILQATTNITNGMILLQDVSSVPMGNVRVDGCIFDSNSFNAPGVGAIANNVANQGVIEADHNEFKGKYFRPFLAALLPPTAD